MIYCLLGKLPNAIIINSKQLSTNLSIIQNLNKTQGEIIIYLVQRVL